ncbi:efflux RND transporter permease subunit [Photobacterium ganghwense]|uniref:efflux RND transporter permease subunit n=1 Tax=Photobacterium ganghwense TaxID=320778 RepID=UPI001C2D0E77|nr:efflux RND transporter permease subunit [Photobacterium ganghwense]MBV1841480.1 efflux RND transporter permease subunit [Photobacterium ganghwense]
MNIAHYSIKNKVISWMFILLMLIGGGISFTGLGQLEFPEFTIKQALVITPYPGASPEQVEEEVTLPLEDAIQQMPQIKHITSINSAGLSQIEVEMQDRYDARDLPQIWDELRRKVNDTVASLPPGTVQPQIIDDFSDVFGILLNLRGDGYSYRELENFANYLRRELVLIDGVKKVSVVGAPEEQVVVEISQEKLAALGLDQNYIYSQIQTQNVVSNAGRIRVGEGRIRIHPTGEFTDVAEMKRLLVSPPGSDHLVYLGDIASVYKTETETPSLLYHSNGEQALSVGISFVSGVNVVNVSQAIGDKIQQLESQMPVGMVLDTVYDQGAVVDASVSGFLINLAESILIVIVVLLVFMGLRSGILMGVVLLLTIFGTFIAMNVLGIELQLISLGALIIALGMLVDNAIVVTEGILIGIQRGQTRLEAAGQVVKQTQWPLLGATVIGIIAFAPIGLSQDATGEFCKSLFQVLLISLFISWITAITITPFFCHLLFKDGESNGEPQELYQGWFFNLYRSLLTLALRFKILTLGLVVAMLVTAVIGMGHVKNVFFPPSNTPIFFVDIWMPEGTDILGTENFVSRIEQDLLQFEAENHVGMKQLTSVIGQGAQRFVLPYAPEKGYDAFAQLMIEMDSLEQQYEGMPKLTAYLRENYSDAEFRVKFLENGPSPAAKIEARFYGEDPTVLRQLAYQAEQILQAEPSAENIRHSWRNQVAVVRPQLNMAQSREVGISKQDLDNAMLINFSGKAIGVYREQTHLMPILARAPEQERLDANSLSKLQVWSPENSTFVPVTQLVSSFDTEWENPIVMRRDRKRVLTVFADPVLDSGETADSVFRKVRADIEAIPLPDGYSLEWGGEYETSRDAQASIFSSLPLGYLFMFLITVLLFNSVRQPLVIWFNVPLAIIGIASGLLLFDAPFSFMAMLGMLSLSGMVIKNGIVLVDQINAEVREGKAAYQAVFDSSVSRVRPVGMAAITTMLGMIPLIFDPFFKAMAVTIIFGLGFATLLTLVVLPVSYALLFRIKHQLAGQVTTPCPKQGVHAANTAGSSSPASMSTSTEANVLDTQ